MRVCFLVGLWLWHDRTTLAQLVRVCAIIRESITHTRAFTRTLAHDRAPRDARDVCGGVAAKHAGTHTRTHTQ